MTSYARDLGYSVKAIKMMKSLVKEYNTDTTKGFVWESDENQVWGDFKRAIIGNYEGLEAINLAAAGNVFVENQIRRYFELGQASHRAIERMMKKPSGKKGLSRKAKEENT